MKAAKRHHPKGFTTRLEIIGEGGGFLHISYCWVDSPRFEVRSEILLVADEVREALAKCGGWRSGEPEYTADNIVRIAIQASVEDVVNSQTCNNIT